MRMAHKEADHVTSLNQSEPCMNLTGPDQSYGLPSTCIMSGDQ